MSDYSRVTRHPNDGKWYEARWHDDYFGDHLYGVSFPGDKVVYPSEQVNAAQLKTFWTADVLETLTSLHGAESVLPFLELLEANYKLRWERDPAGGEGALEWMQSFGAGADL